MAKISKEVHERLVAALSAAQRVYHHPEWVRWATAWQAGKNRHSGPAIEAAAIAGAEAEDQVGRDYAACLSAFSATCAIAWATVHPQQADVALTACAVALNEAKEAEETLP